MPNVAKRAPGTQKNLQETAPSVLTAGFELIKQYGGEEQARLQVPIDIPGSWFGAGDSGALTIAATVAPQPHSAVWVMLCTIERSWHAGLLEGHT